MISYNCMTYSIFYLANLCANIYIFNLFIYFQIWLIKMFKNRLDILAVWCVVECKALKKRKKKKREQAWKG